jgi:hypothetical protein
MTTTEMAPDTHEGRRGEWMQTNSGRRFFPLDPRPEDFTLGDLANGQALDCRYGGQGHIERYYSVAEHAYHGTIELIRRRMDPDICLAFLCHDTAEGLLNDLPRAVKHSIATLPQGWRLVPECPDAHMLEAMTKQKDNPWPTWDSYAAAIRECPKPPMWGYDALEANVQEVILRKYGLWEVSQENKALIKEIDNRICVNEKAALVPRPLAWAADKLEPLPGVRIRFWGPEEAKARWLFLFEHLAEQIPSMKSKEIEAW